MRVSETTPDQTEHEHEHTEMNLFLKRESPLATATDPILAPCALEVVASTTVPSPTRVTARAAGGDHDDDELDPDAVDLRATAP